MAIKKAVLSIQCLRRTVEHEPVMAEVFIVNMMKKIHILIRLVMIKQIKDTEEGDHHLLMM